MGKLLQFERRTTSPADAKAERLVAAEILIFTGVRYERQPVSTPAKPTPTPRAKRKRN